MGRYSIPMVPGHQQRREYRPSGDNDISVNVISQRIPNENQNPHTLLNLNYCQSKEASVSRVERRNDANCCPAGGSIRIKFKIGVCVILGE
jgi:hypothetical protein